MFESAYLKVERAAEHVAQLSKTIRDEKPFTYILRTDCHAGKRVTLAKKNEPIVAKCAIIAGDAVHNLRSALDHAYHEVVDPFCTTDGHRKACQFPFSKTAAGLEEAIKQRLAHLAGDWLLQSLMALKPHSEPGGDEMLCLIHDLDIMDKHRLLIPAGEYKQITFAMLRTQVLDLPNIGGMGGFGNNRSGDIAWPLHKNVYALIKDAIPPSGILEQELNVPVQIVFNVGSGQTQREFVQTLNLMIDATKVAIEAMRKP